MERLNLDTLSYIARYITLPTDIRSFELVNRKFRRAGELGFRVIWTPTPRQVHNYSLRYYEQQQHNCVMRPQKDDRCSVYWMEDSSYLDDDQDRKIPIPIPDIFWLSSHRSIEKFQYPFEVKTAEDIDLILGSLPCGPSLRHLTIKHFLSAERNAINLDFDYWIQALNSYRDRLDSFEIILDDGQWFAYLGYNRGTLYVTDWYAEWKRHNYYKHLSPMWPIEQLIIPKFFIYTDTDTEIFKQLLVLPVKHIQIKELCEDSPYGIYSEKLGIYITSNVTLDVWMTECSTVDCIHPIINKTLA